MKRSALPGHDAHPPALPVQLTAFIGREHEVAEVQRLLGGARLLTLTGSGGSGKTRLALEVAAREAREGSLSIGWVELAGLSDPELIAQQVAEQLAVRDERTGSVNQALIEVLRDRPFLLVLDNCEHLVEAAARLVEMLLRGCVRLRVLATSREPLGLAGERAWLVPPLSLPARDRAPSVEFAATFDALRLFVERARDVIPGFELGTGNVDTVAEICRRLDGLPLAIELAAARMRVLAPEQILERLHDSFRLLISGNRTAIPRHQTLRATIDWSYALLTPEEQRLLDRLSVFSGGFVLEAAEAACAGDAEETSALLDVLARLVDRSLVVMREVEGSARYALLETVRQYAAERLRARGEEADLRRRHAEYFHDLVAAAEPHLTTAQRRPWLDRVQRDIDNVRQALAFTREADPERHLGMTGMLCWFWFSTGYWSEGRRWSEGALALPTAAEPTLLRARTSFAAAVIVSLQAQPVLAHGWLDEVVAIARAHGDGRLEAYANNYLAMVLVQQGKAEGEAPSRAAEAWFRAHHDLYGLRLSLLMLGTLYTAQRDFARAVPVLEEAVAVARDFGLARELGIAVQMLGFAVFQQGDADRAALLFSESIDSLRMDPQYLLLARGLEMVGILAGEHGVGIDAVRLLGAGESLRDKIGAGMFETDQRALLPRIARLRETLGDEPFERAWAAGKRMPLADAIELALAQSSARPPSTTPTPAHPEPEVIARPDLTVRALGPLEITCGESRLEREAWSSAKAKELLLYLLCHPDGRTRARIGLDFWPDASTAQVKNSFHVLLHRLRKAVGRTDVIVVQEDRYRINPALVVHFDAAVFEREIRAARRDPQRLEAAIALYGGDFLAGEAVGDWHLDMHDRLRVQHQEALSTLADLRLAQGDAASAAQVLERLVRSDALREDAHRRLMLCYARAGQRDRALRQYERLVDVLRTELGAAPDRVTVELCNRLRRAEAV